ncbi:hypothetical protein FRB90_000815 [Tulasnella sp. 427]|nr:hypothetical protein FRB90_000815 [Tulasnella sp. 427]
MTDSEATSASDKQGELNYKFPEKPPNWHDQSLEEALKALKDHLQTAVMLELCTIPLYLYAAYSLKNQFSRYQILHIVRQEMLHLGLAGNILCSIGGTPQLYGTDYMPEYPSDLFYSNGKVTFELAPGNKETVATFAAIERPAPPPSSTKAPRSLLQGYSNIGQFYTGLCTGLKTLDERYQEAKRPLFLPDTVSKQLQTDDGSWYDNDMTVITDFNTAQKALEIIIEQGEGNPGEGRDPPSGIGSHYSIFTKLHEKGDLDTYDVVNNIVAEDYTEETFYDVLKMSDAAYCYLLQTIEVLWKYAGPLRGRLVTNNITNLMLNVIKPLALFLAQQKITKGPNKGKHAAFPFRFYPFGSQPFAELKRMTDRVMTLYPTEGKLQAVGKYVRELIDLDQLNVTA